MAPTRRATRQSLLNTSYDLEAQIQEYQRYEQELKDRILARSMQREYDQRRNPPAPVVHPIPEHGPIVPRGNNHPAVNDAPDELPPPSPILAGAPRIQRRRFNEGNRVSVVEREPSTGPIIIRVPHPRAQSNLPIRQVDILRTAIEARAAEVIHESDSSDSDDSSDDSDSSNDDVVALPTPSNNPTNSHNNDSSSSSSSGDSSASVRTTRSTIQRVTSNSNNGRNITVSSTSFVSSTVSSPHGQALIDNDVQMYHHEYEPIDNQPSTSQVIPIALTRKGNPDPTWGDCTMCFEVPVRPQGCFRCFQLIGCKTCVDGWHKTAQNPSCPLCRRKWGRQPDVASMPTIDSRRRSQAVRRSRLRRTQVSADDSQA